MPKNLNRITNHANWLQAWDDWRYVARVAEALGRADVVKANTPDAQAGAWFVDKKIAAIRAVFQWPPVWQMRLRASDYFDPATGAPHAPAADVSQSGLDAK